MSLPELKHIRDLSEMLLGREVVATAGNPVEPMATPSPLVATYVTPTNTLGSVCVVDFHLVAIVGASLGLVPAGAAEDAIAEQNIPAPLSENAIEYLNILAATLSEHMGEHQKLDAVYRAGMPLPPDVVECAIATSGRRDITLDIKGYGTGTMSIVAARI